MLRHPAFAGRLPVFAGDDVTDEDGFAAVRELGGFGVKVGPGASTAAHRVPDVAALVEWLGRLESLL
jgi:trehalose 6-phosphate phosphatase